jgi:hypothetical protein
MPLFRPHKKKEPQAGATTPFVSFISFVDESQDVHVLASSEAYGVS